VEDGPFDFGDPAFFEERDLPPEALRDALEKGDHTLAGPTLPGQGLFLWKIDYYRN
jgi:tRNA pseudouridine38-40 synthase